MPQFPRMPKYRYKVPPSPYKTRPAPDLAASEYQTFHGRERHVTDNQHLN